LRAVISHVVKTCNYSHHPSLCWNSHPFHAFIITIVKHNKSRCMTCMHTKVFGIFANTNDAATLQQLVAEIPMTHCHTLSYDVCFLYMVAAFNLLTKISY
jgi:hypothetical protein